LQIPILAVCIPQIESSGVNTDIRQQDFNPDESGFGIFPGMPPFQGSTFFLLGYQPLRISAAGLQRIQ
jgi:hypothetical protein